MAGEYVPDDPDTRPRRKDEEDTGHTTPLSDDTYGPEPGPDLACI